MPGSEFRDHCRALLPPRLLVSRTCHTSQIAQHCPLSRKPDIEPTSPNGRS
jgi:hypothetical protein